MNRILTFVLGILMLGAYQNVAIAQEFEAELSGSNEVPPINSPAEGEGEFTYNPVTMMLSYDIEFEDLLAADLAAHFHAPAPPGANAPAVITIAGAPGPPPPGPSSPGSPYVGTVGPLTAAQQADLLAGLMYVNIHTGPLPPGSPSGEIRGQLLSDDNDDDDDDDDDKDDDDDIV